jgi:redox-sensing transcriptional repressor
MLSYPTNALMLMKEMKQPIVPPMTIARLPLYLRCLETARDNDIQLISSYELAEQTGRNAAQLRKDLSYLGEFGTRGVGYAVEELIAQISKWLGVVKVRSVGVFGVGKLGEALCNYGGFMDKGFRIVALFDVDPAKLGQEVAGLTVRHLSELKGFVRSDAIEIGLLATPAAAAQKVADKLERCGIKAILNFAPVNLELGPDVCVRNVDLAVELQIIGFHLGRLEKGLVGACCEGDEFG